MPRSLALSGLYPRREPLVKTTWDFDKGLVDERTLRAAFLDDARHLLALQTRLGCAAVTDGNLTWQDPFRGLIESSTGFEVGGVTRFFETNKFYRRPILTGRPVLNREALARHFLLETLGTKAAKKAVLPSPYWLLRSAQIETPTNAPEDALVASLVNDAARWAADQGYEQVQLQEPLLFYEKAPDLELARSLLTSALKGVDATTLVNFPNGNAAPHYAWATSLPTDWVGLDFVETHVDELTRTKSAPRLLAQVIDSQESLLETPAEVRGLAERIETRLRPKDLCLTHTWELDFLPADVAERKLEALAGAALKEVTA